MFTGLNSLRILRLRDWGGFISGIPEEFMAKNGQRQRVYAGHAGSQNCLTLISVGNFGRTDKERGVQN